jgi:hypothetical protein
LAIDRIESADDDLRDAIVDECARDVRLGGDFGRQISLPTSSSIHGET